MPRNMSFALTTEQIRNRTKTVTRRKGWKFLKAGDELWAVEKSQGLKKGESAKRLCLIKVVSVRREPLSVITCDDVKAEGFPDLGQYAFCSMYCEASGGDMEQVVTRIEFEYITPEERFMDMALKWIEESGVGCYDCNWEEVEISLARKFAEVDARRN